jgi:hypothetical protein
MSTSRESKKEKSNFDEEIKKNKNNPEALQELYKQREQRKKKLRKEARKVAKQVAKKYLYGRMALSEVLVRMNKYKEENKWSDSDYDYFLQALEERLPGGHQENIMYNRKMSVNKSKIRDALGAREIADTGLHITDAEQSTLNDILSMYENSRQLFNSSFIIGLQHGDMDVQTLTGELTKTNNVENFIIPLAMALFGPKFDIIDNHMIYSDMGRIVKARHESRQLETDADFNLYYSMISDANDVVCDVDSPIADIKNRYKVQMDTWKIAQAVRTGKYYDIPAMQDFMHNINKCRLNLFENSFNSYGNDDIALLKKWFNIFSMRPTVISTNDMYVSSAASMPMSSFLSQDGLQLSANAGSPFTPNPVRTLTKIAMLSCSLPFKKPDTEDNDEPIASLSDALSQTIWLSLKHNQTPKTQQVVFSNEILVITVDRTVKHRQFNTYINPVPFSKLPLSISSFTRPDTRRITVPPALSVSNSTEAYEIRSVVTLTSLELPNNDKHTEIITGSRALIASKTGNAGAFGSCWMYDPLGAGKPVSRSDNTGYFTNKPITNIPMMIAGENDVSFYGEAGKKGIVFIYAKPDGFNRGWESLDL